MPDLDLTPIRDRLDEFVPAGPVRIELSARGKGGDISPVARLIKHAPADLRALLSEVEALRLRVAEVERDIANARSLARALLLCARSGDVLPRDLPEWLEASHG